jgi:putative glutamine amidotransferase
MAVQFLPRSSRGGLGGQPGKGGKGLSVPVRPLIGLTSYVERALWAAWDKPAVIVPLSYVEAVEEAGGEPVILPSIGERRPETLQILDGLIMVGGSDIKPGLYGAAPRPETTRIRDHRDSAEVNLLESALERKVPLLGVCRGMQLLNILRGGDLVQHVPKEGGDDIHKRGRGIFSTHEVEFAPGSRLAGVMGTKASVPSHHHQAPGRLGRGLEATAWAPDDTIEGIEDPTSPFTVGVLWHPEESDDRALLRCLVEEAASYRKRKGA